eukprot:9100697-Alexandrium_andersonii.AAC.1
MCRTLRAPPGGANGARGIASALAWALGQTRCSRSFPPRWKRTTMGRRVGVIPARMSEVKTLLPSSPPLQGRGRRSPMRSRSRWAYGPPTWPAVGGGQ